MLQTITFCAPRGSNLVICMFKAHKSGTKPLRRYFNHAQKTQARIIWAYALVLAHKLAKYQYFSMR